MFLMAWLKTCEGAKSQRLLTQGPLDTSVLFSLTKRQPGTFMRTVMPPSQLLAGPAGCS